MLLLGNSPAKSSIIDIFASKEIIQYGYLEKSVWLVATEFYLLTQWHFILCVANEGACVHSSLLFCKHASVYICVSIEMIITFWHKSLTLPHKISVYSTFQKHENKDFMCLCNKTTNLLNFLYFSLNRILERNFSCQSKVISMLFVLD